MEDILGRIDVADGVEEALMERDGQAGSILAAVEAYEEADWDEAEDHIAPLCNDPGILSEVYLDSITWAGNRMEVHAA
jgi:c-di-GMP-related signal transduction protein